MQINPTQSQTPYVPVKPQVTVAAASTTQNNDAQTAASSSAVTSDNTDKIKALVQSLMSQSDVRPEVVAGRSANDPVPSPTDDQFQSFIKALRKEPQ